MSRLPPAIVVGIDELAQGVAAVRELGERGVQVHGIARWRCAALYSRWLTRGYLVPESDAALIDLVNAIAESVGECFALACSEAFALALRRAADAGQLHGVRPLVPEMDKLEHVNNKLSTYELAREVGLPLARTWLPQNAQEAAAPPPDLTFPCILKFADPIGVGPLLSRHGLPVFKTKYCYGEEELRRALLAYAPAGCYPLVQSFCPGTGLAHNFFMHKGQALLRFRHIRLLEWPPDGGVIAVCKSLPADDGDPLLAKSEALLRRIGWQGAAQLEYRHDRATGRAAFMEINGRFWSGLSLAHHAGAPFVWLTYAVLGLNQRIALKPYKTDLVCRSVDLEARRLALLLFYPHRVQNRELRFDRLSELAAFFFRFFKPRTCYFLFAWKDPIPCLADLALKSGRMIRNLCAILVRAINRKPSHRALSR